MCSASAAAENDPCSTAARKYVSCCRVIGFAYRSYSQSSLKQSATRADSRSMFALAFLAALGVGVAFAAEDRPGFSERTRLQ
jgi:hypothetical protein